MKKESPSAVHAINEEDGSSTPRPRWLRIGIGIVLVALLIWLGRTAGEYVPQFAEWVRDQGAWGPVVFIAAYAVATMALVPGVVLTLAGGAVFGLVYGTVYVFIAAVLGSTGSFLIARHAARRFVEARLAAHPRFSAIDRAVGQQGLKIVFLMRLSPVFPFSYLNFALGLTKVSLRDYVLAAFGMLPGTLLYVYYGKLIGDVAALAGGASQDRDLGYYLVLGLGLLATAVVTTFVTRIATRALNESTEA